MFNSVSNISWEEKKYLSCAVVFRCFYFCGMMLFLKLEGERGLCLSCQMQKVVEDDGECRSIRM